jgi:hypothetical protein
VVQFEKELKREKIEKMQTEEIEKKESSSSTGKKIIDDLLKDESEEMPNKITEKLKLYEKGSSKVENNNNNNNNNNIAKNVVNVNAPNKIVSPVMPVMPVIAVNPVIIPNKVVVKEKDSFSLLETDLSSNNLNSKENKKETLNKSNTLNVSNPEPEIILKEKKIKSKNSSFAAFDSLIKSPNNIPIPDKDEEKKNSSSNKKTIVNEEKLKEEIAEFSILSNAQDNLFDKVLNQVQNKNKG